MDENNLDSLLDELSSMDGELNENIDIDSGVDVDADDMDDISLDELEKGRKGGFIGFRWHGSWRSGFR